jgi:hypothetical protein
LDLDGRHAAGLLFQPGAAGIDLGAGAAEHGYVIGVFTYGAAEDLNDPVTVWVRISRRAPYILMCYAPELHVLHGAADQGRLRTGRRANRDARHRRDGCSVWWANDQHRPTGVPSCPAGIEDGRDAADWTDARR